MRLAMRCLVLCCVTTAAAAAADARGSIMVQAIDRGVPSDGVRTMVGWHAYVIRLVSNEGNISRVELPSFTIGGIYGSLAQRWTDPTGQGNYTVRSPGFLAADNTTPTELNFDSHLLGDPTHFKEGQPLGNEFPRPLGEAAQFGLFPRTGIPSTPSVKYGATTSFQTFEPILAGGSGNIFGVFEVLDQYQTSTFDLAYIVTDSLFGVAADVYTASSPIGVVTDRQFVVPEPSDAAFIVWAATLILRRKRADYGRFFEQLESRLLPTTTIPSGVSAIVDDQTGIVHISWNDVAGEASYRVVRAANAYGSSETVGGILAADCTSVDDVLPEAASAHYAVAAIDAMGSAFTSAFVAVTASSSIINSSTFQLQSEPSLAVLD